MKIVVPHRSTQQEAMQTVDRGVDRLLSGVGGSSIEIVDKKAAWNGPVMTFSCTGKAGYIAVPLAATITVDETDITVDCELPALVKNFIGEEKVRTAVDRNVRAMIG